MAVIAFWSLILLAAVVVNGHPYGAPDLACKEMKPHHPKTTTSGTPPFAVNLTESNYKPGDVISGTLYSPTGALFRGFLIQARISNDSSIDPLGEFIDLEPYSHTVCGQNERGGLTHNNNTDKEEVQFTWRAPYQPAGDIHFKVTVVQHYNPSRYWMGIVSDTVQDCALHPSAECAAISSVTPGSSTIPPTHSTTKKPSGNIPYDPGCGITKGCFPACRDTGCTYLVTWQAQNHTVKFTLEMQLSNMNDIWIAVGISPADKMDKSNAASCLHTNGKISMQSSHNIGHTNHMYKNANMGLQEPAGSVADGVFKCEWSRMMRMNESTFLDIADNEYYLLVGTGPTNTIASANELERQRQLHYATTNQYILAAGHVQVHVGPTASIRKVKYERLAVLDGIRLNYIVKLFGVMREHFTIPFRSTNKVNFTEHSDVGADGSTSTLIKLHASLMTIAWIILSSVGVVAARHCKDMLPSQMLFKLKIWFQLNLSIPNILCTAMVFGIESFHCNQSITSCQSHSMELLERLGLEIHRTCMVLAVVCIIVAFVAIFMETKGFSEIIPPPGKEYTKAHPYLGIAVTALALLNPMMALFRPAPDAERRYIFNWAHFTVGTSAHILAVITISFGVGLQKAGVDKSALYVLVLYSAVFVVVQTVMEIHRRLVKSDYKQVIDSKKNTTLSASVIMPLPRKGHFRTYVLLVHAILMAAFGGLLVAMICLPSSFHNWVRL